MRVFLRQFFICFLCTVLTVTSLAQTHPLLPSTPTTPSPTVSKATSRQHFVIPEKEIPDSCVLLPPLDAFTFPMSAAPGVQLVTKEALGAMYVECLQDLILAGFLNDYTVERRSQFVYFSGLVFRHFFKLRTLPIQPSQKMLAASLLLNAMIETELPELAAFAEQLRPWINSQGTCDQQLSICDRRIEFFAVAARVIPDLVIEDLQGDIKKTSELVQSLDPNTAESFLWEAVVLRLQSLELMAKFYGSTNLLERGVTPRFVPGRLRNIEELREALKEQMAKYATRLNFFSDKEVFNLFQRGSTSILAGQDEAEIQQWANRFEDSFTVEYGNLGAVELYLDRLGKKDPTAWMASIVEAMKEKDRILEVIRLVTLFSTEETVLPYRHEWVQLVKKIIDAVNTVSTQASASEAEMTKKALQGVNVFSEMLQERADWFDAEMGKLFHEMNIKNFRMQEKTLSAKVPHFHSTYSIFKQMLGLLAEADDLADHFKEFQTPENAEPLQSIVERLDFEWWTWTCLTEQARRGGQSPDEEVETFFTKTSMNLKHCGQNYNTREVFQSFGEQYAEQVEWDAKKLIGMQAVIIGVLLPLSCSLAGALAGRVLSLAAAPSKSRMMSTAASAAGSTRVARDAERFQGLLQAGEVRSALSFAARRSLIRAPHTGLTIAFISPIMSGLSKLAELAFFQRTLPAAQSGWGHHFYPLLVGTFVFSIQPWMRTASTVYAMRAGERFPSLMSVMPALDSTAGFAIEWSAFMSMDVMTRALNYISDPSRPMYASQQEFTTSASMNLIITAAFRSKIAYHTNRMVDHLEHIGHVREVMPTPALSE